MLDRPLHFKRSTRIGLIVSHTIFTLKRTRDHHVLDFRRTVDILRHLRRRQVPRQRVITRQAGRAHGLHALRDAVEGDARGVFLGVRGGERRVFTRIDLRRGGLREGFPLQIHLKSQFFSSPAAP